MTLTIVIAVVAVILLIACISLWKKNNRLKNSSQDFENIRNVLLNRNWRVSFRSARTHWDMIQHYGLHEVVTDSIKGKVSSSFGNLVFSKEETLPEIMDFAHNAVTLANNLGPLSKIPKEAISDAFLYHDFRVNLGNKIVKEKRDKTNGQKIIMAASFFSDETTLPVFIGHSIKITTESVNFESLLRKILNSCDLDTLEENCKRFDKEEKAAAQKLVKFFNSQTIGDLYDLDGEGWNVPKVLTILKQSFTPEPEISMV